MSARVLRREAAQRDLNHHAEFIQRDSPDSAIRFLDAANEAFTLLARMPELGGRCLFRNPKAAGIRVWAIKGFANYLVFYRPIENGIEVVRVLHAARDAESIFEQNR